MILQISAGGGLFVRRPSLPPPLTLYADGRLVTSDPDQAPGLLPELSVRRVSATGLGALITAARAAGLDTAHDDPPVPDATSTTVTLTVGGRTTTSSFVSGGGQSGSATARKRALGFVDAVRSDPGQVFGPAELGRAQAFWSGRLALLVVPAPAAGAGSAAGPARSWPAVGPNRRPRALSTMCTVIDGRSAVAVARALRTARAGTLWHSGHRRWRLTASPLLPGQPDTC